MRTETTPTHITHTGQIMDVVVFEKRASRITVVIGEGVHG